MKNCFIGFYDNLNLGDDLFIKTFCLRYPKTNFKICVNKSYKDVFNDIPNLKKIYYSNILLKANNFLKSRYSLDLKLRKNLKFIKKSDAYFKIGGSIFIEKDFNNYVDLRDEFLTNPNTYVLSSNFGPCKTDDYYNFFNYVFSHLKDVCFRDKYSNKLFKNSRYASDIIFSLKHKTTNGNKVVISVMDLGSRKNLSQYEVDYNKKIISLVDHFTNKNTEVVLMSFCTKEKDNIAVDKIYNEVKDKSKVIKYYYDGNINLALDILSSSKIIIGTRFHSIVLGLLFNKVVVPIIYTDKTKNMLDDIKFKGTVIEIENIKNIKIKDIDFKYKLDVSNNTSHLQFKKTDKILR